MSRAFYFAFCLWAISVVSAANANGQGIIRGTVSDAVSGEAVETATIQITAVNTGKIISYAFTDKLGNFEIKGNFPDSLQITVSILGYKAYQSLVAPTDNLTIKLERQPFDLQEIVVRPGRIWGSRDTINYDVGQFISPQDETIRDVLEKLPGINVDEGGKISYNGKDISNFYVEGMDPVNGRYNQISNNLRAEAVQTVQVMENHQAIKMLEDIVESEEIALNLKLKSEYQNIWMFSLEGAVGVSPLLREISANALLLSRGSQSVYGYKTNNTGNDISYEQNMMSGRINSMFEAPPAISFLSQPSIMAPLKKERLLFNDVHSFTANQLYKLNETTQMRVNANYMHDERKQERGSETVYYQQNDTIFISEKSNTRLRSDEASVNFFIENNAPGKFLTNSFTVSGNWNKSLSDYVGGAVSFQNMNRSTIGGSNDFKTIWKKNENRYEVRSLLRYEHQPEKLKTDDNRQNTLLNRFYTDNSFNIIRQSGYFTFQNSVGFTGDMNNIRNGGSMYDMPSVQWNKNKWQTNFSLPLSFTNYFGAGFSRFSARPSVNLTCKMNYAWRLSLSARYNERYGDILNFFDNPYYTNYRQTIYVPEHLPVQQIQNYTAYGEYKKTSKEFFASLSLSYSQSENNYIYEHNVENGHISIIPWELSNRAVNRKISGTISKGFYDWNLQTSLSYQFNLNDGKQMSKNGLLPFETKHMSLEPKINWSYWPNFNVSYQANINLAGSTVGDNRLTPLWNIIQKFQLSYDISPVEINLSGDHYYNEISSTNVRNDFFMDISLRWKLNKWRFTLSATNLFGRKQYSYTEYSATQSYSSWINIRGREFLLSIRYKF